MNLDQFPILCLIFSPVGIKLLTILKFGLNYLNEHRCKQKFKNYENPKYIWSSENDSKSHFFLHCHFYTPV